MGSGIVFTAFYVYNFWMLMWLNMCRKNVKKYQICRCQNVIFQDLNAKTRFRPGLWPGPAGGAYEAPSDRPVDWLGMGTPPPYAIPFGDLISMPIRRLAALASFRCPPYKENSRLHTNENNGVVLLYVCSFCPSNSITASQWQPIID